MQKREDIKTLAENLLESYAAAWASNNADTIASHWDADETEPFYKAEEVLEYYHQLDDIKAYWRHNERFHDAIRLQFSDIHLKSLAGGYHIAFISMRWDIKFAPNATLMNGAAFSEAGKAMGGENHVLALIRKRGNQVKLCGWSETPNAPLTYMRQLYGWMADKSFN